MTIASVRLLSSVEAKMTLVTYSASASNSTAIIVELIAAVRLPVTCAQHRRQKRIQTGSHHRRMLPAIQVLVADRVAVGKSEWGRRDLNTDIVVSSLQNVVIGKKPQHTTLKGPGATQDSQVTSRPREKVCYETLV